MAAGCHLGFDRTGNSAIRSAETDKSCARTKHEVDRMTRCGDTVILNSTYQEWCIWDPIMREWDVVGGGASIVPLVRAMMVSYKNLIVTIALLSLRFVNPQ